MSDDPMKPGPVASSAPDLTDPDNPEWTLADFARAVGPEGLSQAELAAFPRTRRVGRPKSPSPKQQVTLRLSTEVLEHFRSGGPGWQTRIDETLRRAAERKGR